MRLHSKEWDQIGFYVWIGWCIYICLYAKALYPLFVVVVVARKKKKAEETIDDGGSFV